MQDSFSAPFTPFEVLGAVALNASLNGTTTVNLAATGSVQGDAAAIVSVVTLVMTVPGGSGVILPAYPTGAKGFAGVIINGTVTNLKVYPAGTGTINGGAARAPVTVPGGTIAWIFLNSPTQVLLR